MLSVDTPSQAMPPRKPKFYQSLYVQVIIAIIIGILLGNFFPDFGAGFSDRCYRYCRYERHESGWAGCRKGDAVFCDLFDIGAGDRNGCG